MAQHTSPQNRPCPFCSAQKADSTIHEEILCYANLANNTQKDIFLMNVNEYAEDHMCMVEQGEQAQVLTQSKIKKALLYAKALGPDYEGLFNSAGAATVNHYHVPFCKKKSPVWRNLEEQRVTITNAQQINQIVHGELSKNWVRSRFFKGKDLDELCKQVYWEVKDLQQKNIIHNCKFIYQQDGSFVWLMSPRLNGYMTYVYHFLEPVGTPEPGLVNTCGSIEIPGGDAIMFFELPDKLSAMQKQIMAQRFKKSLDKTCDRQWQPPCYKRYLDLTSNTSIESINCD
ncbi:hypothetical protein [Catenovulum sediminis]|uniref:hypothetical protein n=1 Tax=Catenovulum sediminis TaxID=1740262 RepID=UPI00117D622C|nr:hypothetical protein [Catenovulum sediminis]